MSEKKNIQGITLAEQAMYGFGGMFKYSLGATFLSYYWLFFLTTIAQVPAVLAATVYTIVTAIKTVTMMVAGVICDSKTLKWGKYRGWVLVGDMGLLITTGFLFLRMEYSNPIVYCALLLVFWFLNQLSYNVSWSADRALVGVMATTSKDGVKLSAAAQIASTLAGFAYTAISAPLLAATEGVYQQYLIVAAVMALINIPGAWVTMIVSKKYEGPAALAQAETSTSAPKQQPDKIPVSEMLKVFKGPGLYYFISSTVMNAASGFFSTLLVYYTTYVLNNPLYTGYAVTVQSATGFIAALASPWICSKLSKKWTYFWSLFIGGIACALFYWIGDNGILFLLLRGVITLVTTPVGTAMVAMANDIADYQEMHGSASAKGFVQSMMGVTIRLGILISSALASFGLVAIGYESGTVPTAGILDSIMKLMAFGPFIAYCGGALLILLYKVDEKEIEEYRISKL